MTDAVPGPSAAMTADRFARVTDSILASVGKVIDGKPERKNGSIVLRDETGAEKIRWNFSEAWPSKWTGPALNATTAAVAVESLEITHEELKRA